MRNTMTMRRVLKLIMMMQNDTRMGSRERSVTVVDLWRWKRIGRCYTNRYTPVKEGLTHRPRRTATSSLIVEFYN